VKFVQYYETRGGSTSHQPGIDIEEAQLKIKNLNHVAFVVEEIDSALRFWRDVLGFEVEQIEDVPEQEVRIAFLPAGETKLELIEPASSDSGITRFLQKRGPGMHHICIEIEDIEATLRHLKANDIQLINETPQKSSDGRKYAFIHPHSTNGVLLELYQRSGSP
jgi:methylmalonyl-CoA/ethylmalonyl-CoA epimerase